MANIVDKNTPEFKSFLEGCQDKITNHYSENFPKLDIPVVSHNNGRRYFRIERKDSGQTSVHTFIDRTNGDVLKPAGWKGPAKHARGNIFNNDNGLDCINPYGTAYLRR